MDTKVSLDELKRKRQYIRQRFTRKCNSIRGALTSFSQQDLIDNLNCVKEFSSKLNTIDEDVASLTINEADIENDIITSETYEKQCSEVIKLLSEKLMNCENNLNVNPSSISPSGPTATKIKLPQLPLPTYAHNEGEDLHQFFINFETIIRKYL